MKKEYYITRMTAVVIAISIIAMACITIKIKIKQNVQETQSRQDNPKGK